MVSPRAQSTVLSSIIFIRAFNTRFKPKKGCLFYTKFSESSYYENSYSWIHTIKIWKTFEVYNSFTSKSLKLVFMSLSVVALNILLRTDWLIDWFIDCALLLCILRSFGTLLAWMPSFCTTSSGIPVGATFIWSLLTKKSPQGESSHSLFLFTKMPLESS